MYYNVIVMLSEGKSTENFCLEGDFCKILNEASIKLLFEND